MTLDQELDTKLDRIHQSAGYITAIYKDMRDLYDLARSGETDHEQLHSRGDALLIDLLDHLGHREIVTLWKHLPKHYS